MRVSNILILVAVPSTKRLAIIFKIILKKNAPSNLCDDYGQFRYSNPSLDIQTLNDNHVTVKAVGNYSTEVNSELSFK